MKNRLVRGLLLSIIIIGLLALPAFAAKPAPTESYGNNLSFPAIFAEGYGLTGLPMSISNGLRGNYLNPYLIDPIVYNTVNYYLQKTVNTWQAQTAAGAAGGESVRVDWSDNIVRQTWREDSVIRVETVLFKDLLTPMKGFEMTYLGGEGTSEVWGTTGKSYSSELATVYSICPRLVVQKLDGPKGNVVGTLYNSAIYQKFGVTGPTNAYSAEVNVAGKVIYGFNWNLSSFDMGSIGLPNEPKSGWYRLSFKVDPVANYSITDESGVTTKYSVPANLILGSLDPADQAGYTSPDPVLYAPTLAADGLSTTLELYVSPKLSGKKK